MVKPRMIKAASAAAYVAYLKGRELMHLINQENLEGAVRHLERAVRLDDSYAPAHAQLAIGTARHDSKRVFVHGLCWLLVSRRDIRNGPDLPAERFIARTHEPSDGSDCFRAEKRPGRREST